MNRDEMKKMQPIIQAYVDGNAVEYQNAETGEWEAVDDCEFPFTIDDKPRYYRIKPECKYRPFKNGDECWNEMQKHQPFGWIEIEGLYRSITYVHDNHLHVDKEKRYFDDLCKYASFIDGTPFGIKEGGEE